KGTSAPCVIPRPDAESRYICRMETRRLRIKPAMTSKEEGRLSSWYFKAPYILFSLKKSPLLNRRINFSISTKGFRLCTLPDIRAIQFRKVSFTHAGQQLKGSIYSFPLKVYYAFCLVIDNESAGKIGIVGGNPSRAVVRIALECLDAAQRKHHSASAVTQISPQSQGFNNIKAGNDLARTNYFDIIFKIVAPQGVGHKNECLF